MHSGTSSRSTCGVLGCLASLHPRRRASRPLDQSVSQSVISRSRPALRPLSDVRPLSPSQRTAPLPPVERSPNSLMRSRVKAAWFFEWNSIWWNWSAPLVRRWYAACAGNRALAVTRLDDHFFQGLLWARRLNLGRGPSSPAPSRQDSSFIVCPFWPSSRLSSLPLAAQEGCKLPHTH